MRRIAQILKSNGTEGELLISFIGMDPEDFDPKEPVYVEFDGLPVPFFFESFTRRGNSRALVHMTGVRSLRDADEMAGRNILIDEADDADEGTDILGWKVIDGHSSRLVGTVRDYEDIPGNLCIWVDRPGQGEVLLPLHDDLILDLNEDTQTLVLDIPAGLLEA
jgi:16S rRNA processing protein RimM